MKKFYLPGYYIFYDQFCILNEYIKKHTEQFVEDRIIAGSYDMPSGLLWNGGRAEHFDVPIDKNKIKKIIDYYQNIPNFILLHVCTNTSLNENDCNNLDCNYFIHKYYRPCDKIIIASPLLKSYLSKNYPQISFVNSTTLNIIDINEVNKLSETEIYVPYYSKNLDNNYLLQIKHPENIEILCAESCVPNCSFRVEHYKVASEAMCGRPEALLAFKCPYADKKVGPITQRMKNFPHMVTNDRINELAQLGFTNFKISGRRLNPIEWFEIIVYYLVKPEYQLEAHANLSNQWIQSILGRD